MRRLIGRAVAIGAISTSWACAWLAGLGDTPQAMDVDGGDARPTMEGSAPDLSQEGVVSLDSDGGTDGALEGEATAGEAMVAVPDATFEAQDTESETALDVADAPDAEVGAAQSDEAADREMTLEADVVDSSPMTDWADTAEGGADAIDDRDAMSGPDGAPDVAIDAAPADAEARTCPVLMHPEFAQISVVSLGSNHVDASQSPNRIDVFALSKDCSLRHKALLGSSWYPSQTAWESVGGVLIGPPAAVSSEANRVDIFGQLTNGVLNHRALVGSTWTDWEDLGASFFGPPAAVSWGPGRLDVFVQGLDGAFLHRAQTGSVWSKWESLGVDGIPYHNAFDGSGWTGWESPGGVFIGPLSAVSLSPGRIDAFGPATNTQLYHSHLIGSAWSVWESLGGGFVGETSAVSWGPGRLDVFGLGTDGNVYHNALAVGAPTWSGWEPLGATFVGPPAAIAQPNRLDVFAQKLDGTFYHATSTGTAWSMWESLGIP